MADTWQRGQTGSLAYCLDGRLGGEGRGRLGVFEDAERDLGAPVISLMNMSKKLLPI